ncbi:MAG: CPBP family intramembrane glutamic endopeptidase, partial [Planctomycetota bacterium]
SSSKPRGYLDQSADLTNSLILVVPLLVLYEIGLVVTGFRALNGVDFATVFILQRAGGKGLLAFNLVLLVGILAAATLRKREKAFRPDIVPFLLVESTFYALSLGVLINLVLHKVPGLGPPAQMSPVDGFFASLGAGVNEELFFRLGLLQLLAWVLARGKKDRPVATAVAAILSSLAFSAAHMEFVPYVFLYRFLAGLIFSAIFLGRGFAVAVYTHAIYDIYVLVVLALVPH